MEAHLLLLIQAGITKFETNGKHDALCPHDCECFRKTSSPEEMEGFDLFMGESEGE